MKNKHSFSRFLLVSFSFLLACNVFASQDGTSSNDGKTPNAADPTSFTPEKKVSKKTGKKSVKKSSKKQKNIQKYYSNIKKLNAKVAMLKIKLKKEKEEKYPPSQIKQTKKELSMTLAQLKLAKRNLIEEKNDQNSPKFQMLPSKKSAPSTQEQAKS